MALSKSGLKTRIRNNIIAQWGGEPDDSATLDKFCQAVADAVVDEIVANATITFLNGDIPVQVNITTGAGANVGGGGTGKIT
jgi:tRNA A37 threonylcarbamoyltransferase TsaD